MFAIPLMYSSSSSLHNGEAIVEEVGTSRIVDAECDAKEKGICLISFFIIIKINLNL